MMGGLLMELPGFLGGDEKKAQEYLERAIAADGNFTNARVLVANLYRKQGRIEQAKRQLEAVIRADKPHYLNRLHLGPACSQRASLSGRNLNRRGDPLSRPISDRFTIRFGEDQVRLPELRDDFRLRGFSDLNP